MASTVESLANNAAAPQATPAESAQVTLDALLITYVGAPIGSKDTSSYTITRDYSSTLRLSSELSRGITLTAGVKKTFSTGMDSKGEFTVGGSVTFMQSDSTQVTDGITIRRTTQQQITTQAPGEAGNTVFIGIRRPQIKFEGDNKKLFFRFLKALDSFAVTASDLQTKPGIRGLFRPETIAEFLKQYVPLTDPTGATLVKPRFKPKLSILLSANVRDVFSFTLARGSSFSEQKKSVTSISITESIGFKDKGLERTFSAGQKIEITQTSVQEMATNRILSVSTTLNRSTEGVSKVFLDKVYKTFVIIDAGLPDPSQPSVQGRVTSAQGAPVAGALVTLMSQDGGNYAAMTDASGNYVIRTARGERIQQGSYQLSCGNVNQSVAVGAGVTRADLGRVDPAAARNRELDLGDLLD